MKAVILIPSVLAIIQSIPTTAQSAQDVCYAVDGASVVTEEGDYLGRITNRYESDSIFNSYGTYGSRYSSNSVWNDYGSYGSKYSSTSARNPYASSPPFIVKNRRVIGRLTTNRYMAGAINPVLLGAACYDYQPE